MKITIKIFALQILILGETSENLLGGYGWVAGPEGILFYHVFITLSAYISSTKPFRNKENLFLFLKNYDAFII